MQDTIQSLELNRRAVHLSVAAIPCAYLLELISWNTLGAILAGMIAIATVLEYRRLYHGVKPKFYDQLTRPYEQDIVAGYALYAVGLGAAWVLFPPVAALTGMLLVAIADPLSGMLTSAQSYEAKQIPVLAAMYGLSFMIAAALTIPAYGLEVGALAAALSALGATIVDGFKPTLNGRIIDDNLTIPIVGGAGVMLVVLALGV